MPSSFTIYSQEADSIVGPVFNAPRSTLFSIVFDTTSASFFDYVSYRRSPVNTFEFILPLLRSLGHDLPEASLTIDQKEKRTCDQREWGQLERIIREHDAARTLKTTYTYKPIILHAGGHACWRLKGCNNSNLVLQDDEDARVGEMWSLCDGCATPPQLLR
ncbi:hypothetical protein Ancab_034216 [Ancistrocladus abbreviatus]